MQARYNITGGDFISAGNVASSVKKMLQKLHIDHSVVKRTVVALYEGEVNVVAHAFSALVDIEITDEKIRIVIKDTGPGITDIDKAMEVGYSTASPRVREMGFGAGMGLSNMKKHTDIMNISSEPGTGTTVELINYLKPRAK